MKKILFLFTILIGMTVYANEKDVINLSLPITKKSINKNTDENLTKKLSVINLSKSLKKQSDKERIEKDIDTEYNFAKEKLDSKLKRKGN